VQVLLPVLRRVVPVVRVVPVLRQVVPVLPVLLVV
jgi:hypothetical protein